MPKGHDLKCHPAPFEAAWEGHKSFEIRKDDRPYDISDELYLWEWDPIDEKTLGRLIVARITYILRGEVAFQFGLRDGYCAIGFKKLDQHNRNHGLRNDKRP